MWYYFHWRSILVLSLPHPYFLSPQFPYKALTHRLFWKMLKWMMIPGVRHSDLRIRKKKKNRKNTPQQIRVLYFSTCNCLILGYISWQLTSEFFFSLSLVSNENNDIHLTGCYENWLRKHIWIYPPHCRGHTEDLHLFLWLSMHLGYRNNWYFDQ